MKSDNNQQEYDSWISTKSNGSFVVSHNNAAGNEKNNYIILNGTSDHIKTGNNHLTSGTSTTITDANVNSNSKIFLQATYANEYYNMKSWIYSKGSGSFVIHHQSASGNETFDYVIFNVSAEDNIYTGAGVINAQPTTDTTITDAHALTTSTILLQATANEVWNSNPTIALWRIKTKSNGSFVITSNYVDTGRDFDYVILNT